MGSLLLVVATIALVDSTSITPLCIVPLSVLFTTKRPVLCITAFLGGIFVAYMGTGILIALGLDTILEPFNRWFARWSHDPNTVELVIQLVLGVVMIFFGARLAAAREKKGGANVTSDVGAGECFGVAFGITLAGMPGAVPYFAALDQILRADLSTRGEILALTYYNLVFLAPLISLALARAALGSRIDGFIERMNEFLMRWANRVFVVVLFLLGLLFVADAIAWMAGHPFLPVVGASEAG